MGSHQARRQLLTLLLVPAACSSPGDVAHLGDALGDAFTDMTEEDDLEAIYEAMEQCVSPDELVRRTVDTYLRIYIELDHPNFSASNRKCLTNAVVAAGITPYQLAYLGAESETLEIQQTSDILAVECGVVS